MINGIKNIYVVFDAHSILHASGNILSNLMKKYGEEKVKFSVSIRDYEISESLKKVLNNEAKSYQEKSA